MVTDIYNDDVIYTVVRNKTKNCQVVLSKLGGIEIAPGQTTNLKTMFRKTQLAEASSEIAHFISIDALEAVDSQNTGQNTTVSPDVTTENVGQNTVQKLPPELNSMVFQKKDDLLINEIQSTTSNVARLEDIMKDTKNSPAVLRAAKIQYMSIRGWLDENEQVIPGSMNDENKEITSIDEWEFESFKIPDASIFTNLNEITK